MSHRRRLASLLQQTGVLRALRSSVGTPWLTILTFHRFPADSGVEDFDDDVVDTTLAGFERQIVTLKRHFTLIGTAELCAFARGEPLPPSPVAITFDDGYLDNFVHALPILQRHSAKGIFFIPTSYISERRLHWWDRVAYLVKQSRQASLVLEYPYRAEVSLGDRRAAIERILRLVKTHPALELERFLDGLGHAAKVPWSRDMERDFADRLLMTWDQVRGLKSAGLDVESHTRTHRVLQTLGPEELLDEPSGPSDDLERELGEKPRAIAYPVGNPLIKSSPIRHVLEAVGYEIGLTNCTGANPLNAPVDRFSIRRQSVGLNLSDDYLLALLTLPPLAPAPWWAPHPE